MVGEVRPCVEGGRWPIKRVVGEAVDVEVDLVADGHDILGGRLLHRRSGEAQWQAEPLTALHNDTYRARFQVESLGVYEYTVEAWVDELASWRHALQRKIDGGEHADVTIHLRQGAGLLQDVAGRTSGDARAALEAASAALDAAERDEEAAREAALDPELAELAARHPDLARATRAETVYLVEVERPRARFSSWYEFFPRSCGPAGTHGTLRDCDDRLKHVAAMGFDVVYLPPVHPIGETFRKGRNNRLTPEAGDPGSPWAIGGREGGHKSLHPQLGTLEDFRWFVGRTQELGMEVALDVALQASPDHPYVREHPEWFVRRPDGSIQYAENPPKKYQDIYPFHFESESADALWVELLSIFQFWAGQGVRIFRVDNPHTKSLNFWRWCVAELKRDYPDVILLSEAFTRPKLMYMLAKIGFSQSYTYFTWRNTSHELREYMHELTQTEVAEFFRPNFWPNTPDILPEHLQFGGRPAFVARLVLASTLTANYGMYGPAFELMESAARPGSGEYLDNEKYELKQWDTERPDSLRPVITLINRIRRENPALHANASLRFHACDNEMLLCYSKQAQDDVILVVVNLDFHHTQSGWVHLDLEALDIDPEDTFQVHDLLGGGHYLWHGPGNYVELNPHASPAHIFRIRRRLRTEQDFDYFA
jgi:starch synthase (maltosyl-transferring)